MTVLNLFEAYDTRAPLWWDFVHGCDELEPESFAVAIEEVLTFRLGFTIEQLWELDTELLSELYFHEGEEFEELRTCANLEKYMKLRSRPDWPKAKKNQRRALIKVCKSQSRGRYGSKSPSWIVRQVSEGSENKLREACKGSLMRKELLAALRQRKAGRADSLYQSLPRAVVKGWFSKEFALKNNEEIAEYLKKRLISAPTEDQVRDAKNDHGLIKLKNL